MRLNGDVAEAIAQWLHAEDLARFCAVSRMVYGVTLPVLYRNVYIVTSHARRVHAFAAFYATIVRRPVLGRFVKSLFISYHGPTSNVLRLLGLLPRLQSLHSAHTFRSNTSTIHAGAAIAALSSLSCEWTPWLDQLMGHMQPVRRLHVDIPNMRRDAPPLSGMECLLLASLHTLEDVSITDARVLHILEAHQHLAWPRVRKLHYHVTSFLCDTGELFARVFPQLRQLHGRGGVDMLSSAGDLPALDYAQVFVPDYYSIATATAKTAPTARRSLRHLLLDATPLRESSISANMEVALAAVRPEKLQSLAIRLGADLIPVLCSFLANCFSLSYLLVCCRSDTALMLCHALARLRPQTGARLRCIGFNLSPMHAPDPIIVEKLELRIGALKTQFPSLRLVELRTLTRTKLLGALSIANVHWRMSHGTGTGTIRRVQSDFSVWDVASWEGPEQLDALQVLR